MEKRIELERRGQPPGSILDLNLDNCRSTSIIGLTDEFSNLRSLSLINVGLISLRGFPKLPNLVKIELSDNRISGGLYHLHGSPKLVHINLGGNRISDFEALEPLKEFKHLKCLDLFANNIECYKEKVFNLLPSLVYLDGLDRDEKEMTTDDEEVNGIEDESDSEESSSSSVDGEDSDGNSVNKYDNYDLGKVYDPALTDESDNEDYDGEGVEEEDDDDFDEDEEEYSNVYDEEQEEEEEADAPAPAPASASEEDSSPRGKKRKHEDAEEGQDV